MLVGGKPVVLTAVEFKLLSILTHQPGRVQARNRLLNEVWGYQAAIDTRTVDTDVRRLREKLGKAAGVIETVRGFGYPLRNNRTAAAREFKRCFYTGSSPLFMGI